LAVAFQLDYPVKNDPRPRFMEAILSNFNYQLGCNPVNVCYLTGLGSRRPREIVHHYASNDRRVLPPAGIPIGDVQSDYTWMDFYKRELGALSFPLDGDARAPYPIYDRWADTFNLSTEFVILNQARGLAAAAFLLAQTPLKSQPWKPVTPLIVPTENAGQSPQEFKLRNGISEFPAGRIIWEASGEEPSATRTFIPRGPQSALSWIEAEAVLPNGWLVFGQTNRSPAVSRLSSDAR
jgi:hypothetical protein